MENEKLLKKKEYNKAYYAKNKEGLREQSKYIRKQKNIKKLIQLLEIKDNEEILKEIIQACGRNTIEKVINQTNMTEFHNDML
jgi:uncharacterized protein YjgD (DUF1641 family)